MIELENDWSLLKDFLNEIEDFNIKSVTLYKLVEVQKAILKSKFYSQ